MRETHPFAEQVTELAQCLSFTAEECARGIAALAPALQEVARQIAAFLELFPPQDNSTLGRLDRWLSNAFAWWLSEPEA